MTGTKKKTKSGKGDRKYGGRDTILEKMTRDVLIEKVTSE